MTHRFKVLWSMYVALYLMAGVAHGQQQRDPWVSLDKTGWIWLGLWDEQRGGSGTLLSDAPVGPSTTAATAPSAGETIRMTHEQSLVILGYPVSGEARNRESPAGIVRKPSDETDLQLPIGETVIVYEIQKGAVREGLRDIWARVGPTSHDD